MAVYSPPQKNFQEQRKFNKVAGSKLWQFSATPPSEKSFLVLLLNEKFSCRPTDWPILTTQKILLEKEEGEKKERGKKHGTEIRKLTPPPGGRPESYIKSEKMFKIR